MITIFKNITETNNPYYVDLDTIVSRIMIGKNKELVEKIRTLPTKKERDELKKLLPSICFSGEFTRRANDKIKSHSGYICLDFDHLEDVSAFKKRMTQDEYVCCAFISPSGDGVKVVIKIPANILTHKASCKALQDYFKNDKLDNFEDIARVCYESYDLEIYYNPDSKVFDKLLIDEVIPIKTSEKNTDANEIFNRLKTWIEKTEYYADGNKHRFLVKLAGALNRFGVSQYDAINLLISHYRYLGSEVKEKDFETIVRNVYRNYSNQFNTEYFEKNGIAYNRITRIETASNFHDEYKYEDESENLLNELKECLITFESNITKPPTILSIRNEFDFKEISIMTSGNISVIKGKAKSKKTYLLKMFASTLIKNFEVFRNIVPTLPENKRNVIIIDTEQSRYDTKKMTYQIVSLAKCSDSYLTTINFRGKTAQSIIKQMKFIVEKFTNIGIIFIDQVADLVKSLNNEEEAIKIVKFLEQISVEKDLHICCIVHINKQDNFAQGWLGTQLMKKAETIINVSKHEASKRLGIVEPDLTRGEEFEPFVFSINDNGLPELLDHSAYDELSKKSMI